MRHLITAILVLSLWAPGTALAGLGNYRDIEACEDKVAGSHIAEPGQIDVTHGPILYLENVTVAKLSEKTDNPQHQRWIKWSGLTVASAVVCRPTALVFALVLLNI